MTYCIRCGGEITDDSQVGSISLADSVIGKISPFCNECTKEMKEDDIRLIHSLCGIHLVNKKMFNKKLAGLTDKDFENYQILDDVNETDFVNINEEKIAPSSNNSFDLTKTSAYNGPIINNTVPESKPCAGGLCRSN